MLLAVLMTLLLLIGYLLGGTTGIVLASGLALLMNLGTYWFSHKIVLAMTDARDISPAEAPELHHLVERLALQAGMPKPRVYVVEATTPNAFAAGRNAARAVLVVTSGIMRNLDRDELAGVLAHELAHIKNRDTLTATVAAATSGVIMAIASLAPWPFLRGHLGHGNADEGGRDRRSPFAGGILMILLAPIAAALIHLALSPAREFGADALGAQILGDPLPLARALEKLESANRIAPLRINPAMAHQFTIQPLVRSGLMDLFSTHPSMEERVARLRQMALRPTPSLSN